MELFIIDEFNEVVCNKVEIYTIPSFSVIYKRDKGVSIDKIKKKRVALKEFALLFHLLDYKSPYSELNDKERFPKVFKDFNTTEKDFLADVELQAAFETYKEFRETRGLRFIKAGFKALEAIKRSLESYDLIDQIPANVASDLSKLLNDFPKNMETLKKLDEQLKAELADKGSVRGGHQKGYEEDPD